uniref:Uncharacterized protein n=1 Tax=Oryza punctata TaxID=4537 RepID=A0A0E0LJX0_ORYPU
MRGHRISASSPAVYQVGARYPACSQSIHAVGLMRERVRDKDGSPLPRTRSVPIVGLQRLPHGSTITAASDGLPSSPPPLRPSIRIAIASSRSSLPQLHPCVGVTRLPTHRTTATLPPPLTPPLRAGHQPHLSVAQRQLPTVAGHPSSPSLTAPRILSLLPAARHLTAWPPIVVGLPVLPANSASLRGAASAGLLPSSTATQHHAESGQRGTRFGSSARSLFPAAFSPPHAASVLSASPPAPSPLSIPPRPPRSHQSCPARASSALVHRGPSPRPPPLPKRYAPSQSGKEWARSAYDGTGSVASSPDNAGLSRRSAAVPPLGSHQCPAVLLERSEKARRRCPCCCVALPVAARECRGQGEEEMWVAAAEVSPPVSS